MELTKRTAAPAKTNKYYYSNSNIYYASGVGMNVTSKNKNGGNCTAYCDGRMMESQGRTDIKHITGNAEDWLTNAKKLGYKTGSEPAIGSVAVWKDNNLNNSSDGCGHVAFVEAIDSDGTCHITGSGWNTYVWKEETMAPPYKRGTHTFLGFIYPLKAFDNPSMIKYQGYLDSASTSKISGWCWNGVDDTAVTVTVEIYSGKLTKAPDRKKDTPSRRFTTTASSYREDLKAAGKGNGKHGFAVSVNLNSLPAGNYTVIAYAPDGTQLSNLKCVSVVRAYMGNYKDSEDKFHRVGKGWSNGKCIDQAAAYKNYLYAVNYAKKNGLKVFDNDGQQNYPL